MAHILPQKRHEGQSHPTGIMVGNIPYCEGQFVFVQVQALLRHKQLFKGTGAHEHILTLVEMYRTRLKVPVFTCPKRRGMMTSLS